MSLNDNNLYASSGFKELDNKLLSNYEKDADFKDFLREPKDFRSLQHVMTLLRDVNVFGSTAFGHNPIYLDLLDRKKAAEANIEKVVKFQHGGLNHTVDTMSEVVKSYVKGRDEIKTVCDSLAHTKEVLGNKKTNQLKLRELWLKKLELEESLRMIKDIEYVKDAPSRVQKLISQKRYLAAVTTLKLSYEKMFHEDLTAVGALSHIHKVTLDLKETILEKILNELQEAIHENGDTDSNFDDFSDFEEEDGNFSDTRSESAGSTATTSFDSFSVVDGGGTATTSNAMLNKDYYDKLLDRNIDRKHVESLLNLSHSIEDKILEPSKSGLLFVRLLVKSLTDLHNEDDYVEELLFNNLSDKFMSNVILQERRKAISRLQRKLEEKDQHIGNNNSSSDNYNNMTSAGVKRSVDSTLYSRIFSSYITNLLNHSVQCFKTICYVLRLLDFARQLINDTNANDNDSRYDDNADSDNDGDSDNEIESTDGLEKDDDRKVYSNNNNNGNGNGNGNSKSQPSVLIYTMNEANKGRLRDWWASVEKMICDELKRHLIEMDVESISDNSMANKTKDNKNQPSESLYIDDSSYSASAALAEPIVPPTAKLAAPIYKKIIKNNEIISKLVLEEGLYLSVANSMNATVDDESATTANNHKISAFPTKLTILQQIAKSQYEIKLSTYSSSLVAFMNKFLEKELLPITQSYINTEMREIQSNPKLFNFRLHNQIADDARATGFNSKTNNSSAYVSSYLTSGTRSDSKDKYENLVKVMNQDIVLNTATIKCSTVAQLLYNYWVDLSNHRDMVVTILDRLVRGFTSCAKVEIENISWKSMSGESDYINQSLRILTNDELFSTYRQKLYKGNISIEQIVSRQLKNIEKKDSTSGDYSSKGKHTTDIENKTSSTFSVGNSPIKSNASDLTMWAILFGNLGNSSTYPVNKKNTVKEVTSLETCGAILQGCEWLSFELIKYCTLATTKDTRDWQPSPEYQLTKLKNSSELLKLSSRISREQHIALWKVTEEIAKKLTEVSEMCLAFIKNEVQIICFMHLNQLSSISSLKASFVSPRSHLLSGGPNNETAASKQIATDTTEAEIILDELIHHINLLYNVFKTVLPREIIAIVMFPLCALIPRILIKCCQHLINPYASSSSNFNQHNYMNDLPLDPKKAVFYLDSGKYLRIVAALQQLLTNSIESFQLEPTITRQFIDRLIEESEKLRKYLKLLEMTPKELKGYIRENSNEYTSLEYKTLWDAMCAKSSEKQLLFEEFLAKLKSK